MVVFLLLFKRVFFWAVGGRCIVGEMVLEVATYKFLIHGFSFGLTVSEGVGLCANRIQQDLDERGLSFPNFSPS